VVEGFGERGDGDVRAFQDAAGGLQELVDEERPVRVEHGGVVLGAPVVQPDDV